jgi:ferredoxin-NADP reductase
MTAGQIRGYVQDALFRLTPSPATDHFLLCGNPKMIDDIYPKLKQLGFGVKQVIREKYVFAKAVSKVSNSEKTPMSEEQKRILVEKMKKYSS